MWIRWEAPKRENGSPVHLYQIELIDHKTHLENEKKHGQHDHHSADVHSVKKGTESESGKKKLVDLKTVGSVDKWHRLVIHTHLHDRFRLDY